MNKKILVLSMLSLFAISFVVALTYYGFFSVSFLVSPSIIVGGDLEQELEPTYAGEVIEGEEITITNNAPTEREISLSDDSGEDVSVSYVSDLDVAQKVVNFELDVWELLPEGQTAIIEYVIVGDEFTAEVTSGVLEDHVLVYYKDNSDRFNSPATAIGINSIVGNLAYEDDANNDEYDYCDTGEYVTCHGAKLWYLPADVVDSEGNVNWARAGEVLFETELIQYNSDGQLTIYPGQTLIITPVYTIGDYASGTYNITTTVA